MRNILTNMKHLLMKEAFELELELNDLNRGSAIDLSCHYD